MKVKVCIGLILAIVATTCLCRPAAEAPGSAGDPRRLPASLVRRDWPESLTQEQKHLISQFLPHIFTGTGRRRVCSPQGPNRAEPDPHPPASPQPGAALTCCPCPGRAERPQELRARGGGDGGPARPLLPRLDGLWPPQCRGLGRCRVAAEHQHARCMSPPAIKLWHYSGCRSRLCWEEVGWGRAGGNHPQSHQEAQDGDPPPARSDRQTRHTRAAS